MIKTGFEVAANGFLESSKVPEDERPSVRLSQDVSARLIYRNHHHLLSDRTEMRLSVFAVKEPGHRRVNALHTIEHIEGWPKPGYGRFPLDTVTVSASGITLPERLYLPPLLVQCSLGGLMLVGWGKLHFASGN